MSTLTRWVLSHKLLVVPLWIILTIVGFASAQSATRALSTQFTVPGGEGITTSAAILKHFGSGGTTAPIVPVLTLPGGVTVNSPGVKARLAADFNRIALALPGSRVASYADSGDHAFVSRDGRTTFGLVYPPASFSMTAPTASVPRVQAAVHGLTIDGARFQVTGLDALSSGSGNSGGNGVLAETMLAGLGSLVVLLVVFGSALAILPLLMALVAIPTTFLLIWGLASVTYVSFIIEFLVALVGLGVAIDYSLLVVMRWREERARGLANEPAVVRAME
ncbi:MAG: MMPL family transporter, partial [Chloroflexota bacterium]|nr:MMPL family transporter [Chloroflexota bacterium]